MATDEPLGVDMFGIDPLADQAGNYVDHFSVPQINIPILGPGGAFPENHSPV